MMTNEEKIAVALFGWVEQACDEMDCKCYTNSATSSKLWLKSGEAVVGVGLYAWPGLSDWNWIRKIEEALEARGLLDQYDQKLATICHAPNYEYTATAEQRVQVTIWIIGGTKAASVCAKAPQARTGSIARTKWHDWRGCGTLTKRRWFSLSLSAHWRRQRKQITMRVR